VIRRPTAGVAALDMQQKGLSSTIASRPRATAPRLKPLGRWTADRSYWISGYGGSLVGSRQERGDTFAMFDRHRPEGFALHN